MKSVRLDTTATSDAKRPIAAPEITNRACFIHIPHAKKGGSSRPLVPSTRLPGLEFHDCALRSPISRVLADARSGILRLRLGLQDPLQHPIDESVRQLGGGGEADQALLSCPPSGSPWVPRRPTPSPDAWPTAS